VFLTGFCRKELLLLTLRASVIVFCTELIDVRAMKSARR
jgi:hypothetical protein